MHFNFYSDVKTERNVCRSASKHDDQTWALRIQNGSVIGSRGSGSEIHSHHRSVFQINRGSTEIIDPLYYFVMGSDGIIDPMNLQYMKFLAPHTLEQAL